MTTTRDYIRAAVLAWLQAAAGSPAPTDAQVIYGDEDGPRPPLPYMTLTVLSDVGIGVDEQLDHLASTFTVASGGVGDVYGITVAATPIAYTRTADDSDADVALALAELVAAADGLDARRYGTTGLSVVVWSTDADALDAPTLTDATANITSTATDLAATRMRGQRSATVSVQGFGAQAVEWLAEASLALGRPDVQELLDAAGLTVVPLAGATSTSLALDTGFEQRALAEFTVSYAVESTPVVRVEALTADVDVTLEGAPTDLAFTVSASLS